MGDGVTVKGDKGFRSLYVKDAIVKPASSGSDLELEGAAKFADPDFKLEGFNMVTIVGDGELDSSLKSSARSLWGQKFLGFSLFWRSLGLMLGLI